MRQDTLPHIPDLRLLQCPEDYMDVNIYPLFKGFFIEVFFLSVVLNRDNEINQGK